MLRESRLGKSYLKWVEAVPIPFFERLALRPDHLTFLAFFFSLLTVPAYYYSLWLGGMGVLVSGALDTMDGGLARKTNRKSPSGAFLDSVLDRYSDFFAVFGLWLYFSFHPARQRNLITALLLLFLAGSFLVSYSRARGEGLGVSASVGWFGRAERVICLGIGSILDDLSAWVWPRSWSAEHIFLVVLLFFLTLGTHITALQRIIHLAKRLAKDI